LRRKFRTIPVVPGRYYWPKHIQRDWEYLLEELDVDDAKKKEKQKTHILMNLIENISTIAKGPRRLYFSRIITPKEVTEISPKNPNPGLRGKSRALIDKDN
jgi:hypothetical protein